MELYIVHVIFTAAVLYLARWFYKSFGGGKKKKQGCSSCPSCETSNEDKLDSAQTPTHSSAGP